MKKFFMIGIFLVTIMLLLGYFYTKSINILFISLSSLYGFCILDALGRKKRIFYLFFLITFFIFLLSQYTYFFFTQESWWGNFELSTIRNTIFCLMLSLLGIYLGCKIAPCFKKITLFKMKRVQDNSKSIFTFRLQKISKALFWVTFIPTLYTILDKILFSLKFGYDEVFLNYNTSSVLLTKIAIINKIGFFMFLATMPSKKESRLTIISFLFFNIITMFVGFRTFAVTAVLVILFYYSFRNRYDSKIANGEVWLSRKTTWAIILATPVVIVFLSFWSIFRSGVIIGNIDFQELFFGFFKSQGGSVHIISYVQELKDQFPSTNLNYTFGPVINLFKDNFIIRIITNAPVIRQQTLEAALYGNNMSQTITYLLMPKYYFAGGGLGSSYIAELLFDFSYVGVLSFNIILGVVLYKIDNFNPKKPWGITLYFLMLQSLLTLPRTGPFTWFVDAFNITTLGCIVFMYLLARTNLIRPPKKVIKNSQ